MQHVLEVDDYFSFSDYQILENVYYIILSLQAGAGLGYHNLRNLGRTNQSEDSCADASASLSISLTDEFQQTYQ